MNAAIGMQGAFQLWLFAGPHRPAVRCGLTRHCLLIRVSAVLLPLSQRRRAGYRHIKKPEGICKTAYGKIDINKVMLADKEIALS